MQCSKVTYLSKTHANETANRMRKCKRTKKAGRLRPYICPQCGKYHLTSKDEKQYK